MNDDVTPEQWRRHRVSADERAHWVRRFHASGLSRREFVQRHGMGLSTLDRWLTEKPVASAHPPLREVNVGSLLSASPWIAEVQRADGLVVRLGPQAWPLLQSLFAGRPC
jgi:hypothetical protein